MTAIRIDMQRPRSDIVERAAVVIRQGGIVLSPTDTIYGLACHPFQPAALKRLLGIKGRSEGKGLLLLIPDSDWVERLALGVPKSFSALAREIWPGPVTVLLQGKPSLSSEILGKQGKVGCRQPASPFLQDWMRVLGVPLVSTSANLSGQKAPFSLKRLRKLFASEVDLFLEAGEPVEKAASTVVDLTTVPPEIVRRGVRAQEVERALQKVLGQ